MKLTRYYEVVKIDEERYYLLNTLTAKAFVIGGKEYKILEALRDNVLTKNTESDKFVLHLKEEGFLLNDIKEEEQKVLELTRFAKEGRKRRAESVAFVLTYGCNFACPYCYEGAPDKGNQPVITKEMVDRVFELYDNNIPFITLYGGEPLLKGNREIIEYIISKAPDASYGIVTNGYNLIDYKDILKRISIDNIMITLDGNRDIHNRTRILKNHRGSFDRIQAGIDFCLSNSIRVKIRMNISEHNIDSCETVKSNLIKEYKDAYAKGFLLFEMQPIFQIKSERRDNLERRLYFPKEKGECLANKDNIMVLSASPILQPFISSSTNRNFPKVCNCDAEGKIRFYDPDGRIYSCILSVGMEGLEVGTYYPEYKLYDKSIMNRTVDVMDKCSKCKYRFLCGGGCALAAYNTFGDVYSSNCERFMNELHHVLPSLLRERLDKNVS